MKFTYDSYKKLILLLQDEGYEITDYQKANDKQKCAIIRHDVDNSLTKACKMAELEQEIGIHSTYFVMVTSEFYNLFSENSESSLKSIINCGHSIGLHFDEKRYSDLYGNPQLIKEKIIYEARLLSFAAGCSVECMSMHRPSKEILDANLKIDLDG